MRVSEVQAPVDRTFTVDSHRLQARYELAATPGLDQRFGRIFTGEIFIQADGAKYVCGKVDGAEFNFHPDERFIGGESPFPVELTMLNVEAYMALGKYDAILERWTGPLDWPVMGV